MVNRKLSKYSDDTVSRSKDIHMEGYLNKWTNYIYGWQRRWVVLKDGALSYYKEQNETECGCRGAISLFKAHIKAHEFDSCRFDVSVDDCAWCLRTETTEEKEQWIKAVIYAKQISENYNGEGKLRRHGSNSSLTSSANTNNTWGSTTPLTFQKSPELKLKLVELDTLAESLCSQVDNLQQQFIKYLPSHSDSPPSESPLANFKVDVMTCKATALSVSEELRNCIDIVSLQEDAFANCLEQLINEKPQLPEMHDQFNSCTKSLNHDNNTDINKNRNEKKANQNMEDELFYDAVDARVAAISLDETQRFQPQEVTQADENENHVVPLNKLLHRLSAEIEHVTCEQIKYAKMGISKDGWQLFAEEGEMKMYRRVFEVDGVVIDPLKACHFVRGFTAHEICHYFFKPEYRYEWETTLDPNGMTILEKLDENTIIFHQVHKRVWPAAQRDAVFWSHMRQIPKCDEDGEQVLNSYVVVNQSTDVESHPANATGHCVRMNVTVSLLCQTVILNESKDLNQLSRDDIACKIMYCAVINPGGWVPASGLRIIYKREYPRFLRKFTAYVTQKTKDNPVLF